MPRLYPRRRAQPRWESGAKRPGRSQREGGDPTITVSCRPGARHGGGPGSPWLAAPALRGTSWIPCGFGGPRLPEFPRLVKHVDFGPSSLGRQAYELAAPSDDRQRRQWARWADQHRGRQVDLVKRALPASPGANPVEVIRSWLPAGQAARRASSAFYLAHKPVVLLDPPALRGTFAWRGPDEPG
jgi:hypothetical protein